MRKPRWVLLAGLSLVPLALGISLAQSGGEATPQASSRLGPDELDELVASIALYPDEMVALVLAASTQPFELMEASRYLATVKGKVPSKVDVDWDDSVKELLHYPDILQMLNRDLDWTTKLGQGLNETWDQAWMPAGVVRAILTAIVAWLFSIAWFSRRDLHG